MGEQSQTLLFLNTSSQTQLLVGLETDWQRFSWELPVGRVLIHLQRTRFHNLPVGEISNALEIFKYMNFTSEQQKVNHSVVIWR